MRIWRASHRSSLRQKRRRSAISEDETLAESQPTMGGATLMRAYAARRLLALIPTIIFASLIVFVTLRLVPGDVIDLMMSQNDIAAGAKDRAQLEQALGLDKPIYVQYFLWIGGVLRGDLGQSLWHSTPVLDQILSRLPITFGLGFLAIIIGLMIAIPIGVCSALRQDTAGDYIMRSLSILMLAVPAFWTGTMVMVFPAIWWGWSPEVNYIPFSVDPIGNIRHMLLPALILGMSLSAITMRLTRTMMLEVLRQDYIRTAWAKGLSEWTIVTRHALRNALIPVVTLVGIQAPLVIGGAVILEQIFVIPGMGMLLLEGVTQRDYPIVAGVFLVVGLAVMLINLIVDLSYGLLDPKVRYR